MAFVYVQRTGNFYAPDKRLLVEGYSGRGQALDDPMKQGLVGEGPIPTGHYSIGMPQYPPGHLGPLALPLTPLPGTNTLGRSGFFIHGDNSTQDHTASHGCIILDRVARQRVVNSSHHVLVVVAEQTDLKGAFA